MTTSLKEYCYTNNELNDDFVGIRSKDNNLQICFPLGFSINNNRTLRADIRKLFSVLLEHNKAFYYDTLKNSTNKIVTTSFPLLAYKNIVEYFLLHGYYKENKNVYENNIKGKINFSRTIKNNKPIIQNRNDKNSFVYTRFQVKKKMINESELIVAINKYCVYEAFSKFGFVFSSFMPPKFKLPTNKNYCIYLLDKKLNNTFNDNKRTLFGSMKNMLLQNDNAQQKSDFKFGTNSFYVIWERMIDKAFGINDKDKYFPKTKWKLHSGEKYNHPLQPDSIMNSKEKIYILDAKYYKYGTTAKMSDLPNSSSIAKQIIYGEYIQNKENSKEVYNAFIMPFNKHINSLGLNQDIENIGFACGEWSSNKDTFEKIQGILIDTRFLMQNYNKQSSDFLKLLAEHIG